MLIRIYRPGALLLTILLSGGAFDSHAQRSNAAAEQCFRNPTRICLLDQAMDSLSRSEYPDPDALTEIAAILGEAGEVGRAQAAFMRALDQTMLMGWPELRAGMYEFTARVVQSVLEPDRARTVFSHTAAVARDMELPDIRAMALHAVAMADVSAGRLEEAHDVFNEALDVAMEIPWDELRRFAFTSIVDSMVTELPRDLAGASFERALDLADDALKGMGRWVGWARMAAAQAKLGDVDAALKIADAIDSDAWRSGARGEIAVALAAMGDVDQAVSLLREGVSDYQRNEDFTEIAYTLAQDGERAAALEAAEHIGDADLRETVVARVYMTGQDVDFGRALAAVMDISDDDNRITSLFDLAFEHIESELEEEARRRLIEALLLARELIRDGRPGWLQQNTATALAGFGEFSEALATVDAIDDADGRLSSLRDVASITAERGDIEQALSVVAQIRSASDDSAAVAEPLAAIASAYAEAGLIEQALATVEQVDAPGPRAVALARIACTLPR